MKTRNILIALLLSGTPQAFAQPVSADVSIAGEPVASVDVFYDQLSPYGAWASDARFGSVFIPAEASFVPYVNGHWVYTDAGMVWVSPEPFAWATSHYGRWWYSDDFGRWVWVPDTTWGASWVDWRETEGEWGWAPLAPAGFTVGVSFWRFVPVQQVFAVNVSNYFVPRARVETLVREARPIENRAQVADRLRAQHVEVRPVKLEPKQIGRMTTAERTQAETHARDNRAAVEERNRTQLEKIAPKAKPPATLERKPGAEPQKAQPERKPAEPEQKRPEPQKAEPQKRPEPQKAEPQKRPEPQKAEPQKKPEPQKAEPQKAEPQKAEPQQRAPEPPKAEPPKAEPQQRMPEPAPKATPKPEPKRENPPPATPTRPVPQTTPTREPEPKKQP